MSRPASSPHRRRDAPGVRRSGTLARVRGVLPVLAGFVAAEIQLGLGPEASPRAAAGTGLKVALACWSILALCWAAASAIAGRREEAAIRSAAQVPGRTASTVHRVGTLRPFDALAAVMAWRPTAGHVIAGGVVVLCLSLGLIARNPGRLALHVLGFLLTGVAVAWVVQRRAGQAAARRAVLALAVFATIASLADVRTRLVPQDAAADSPFRWAVGWPTAEWVLRHELRPEPPLEARPMVLRLPLARPYDGAAQIFAWLNGQELGAARRLDSRTLEVAVPAHVLAGQPALRLELRQSPVDSRLRLIGHRSGRGATFGLGASSYFDGEQWRPGTYNDALGRPQDGIYVLLLTHPQG
jgi:hypothetical protein